MIGIYKIENKVNGKIYIGQSVNIENRWKQHMRELNKSSHKNQHLLSSWKKYGKENFEFSVICTCNSDELDEKEIYYIDLYKTYNYEYGYNMTIGGVGARYYYDTDLILNTYKSTNSVTKTSEILKYFRSSFLDSSSFKINGISNPKNMLINMILNVNICLFKFLNPQDAKISADFLESIILNISFNKV